MKTFVFILFLSLAIGFGSAQNDNNGCRDFCEDECIPLGDVACGQLIINTGDKCRCQNRCLNRFPSWRVRCDDDDDCVAPLRCVGANANNQGRCQPGKCDECDDKCGTCAGRSFAQCIHRTRNACDCQDSCISGYDEYDSPCISNGDCGSRTICIDGTCRPKNCGNERTPCDVLCDACDDLDVGGCADFILENIAERCECTDTCFRRYREYRGECGTDNDCIFPLICRGDKCIPDDDCVFVSTEAPPPVCYAEGLSAACTIDSDCIGAYVCYEGFCRYVVDCPLTCDEKCIEACEGKTQQECSHNILNDIDNLCECQEECLSQYAGYEAVCENDDGCVFPLICRGDKCIPDNDCVFVSTTTPAPVCYGEGLGPGPCATDENCSDSVCVENICREVVDCNPDPCGEPPSCGDCGHYSRCENDVCCPECYRETYQSCSTENDYRCCPGNTCTAISTSDCDVEICLPDEPDCPFCQDCHIDSCPHFDADECHFGVGYDYCDCCPYCLRGPGEYCGGPHDFYGRCGDGFYCQKFGNYWWSVGICVC